MSGVISDKDLNNEPLAFANVMIKGTTIGTSTDSSGKYSVSAEAGNHILVISFIGYETVEVPVTVKANQTITVNKTIGSGSVKLEDIIVKSTGGNREKETALLLDQKNAVEMRQAIGAQELSRKGVSDAAGAVAKTAGVSEQEGVKNVFVRGLGDRYNSTSLNGLPLPSEDPEYKNISLKFFSTNIIKNINVNKIFTSNVYGDVGGANIDIASSDLEKSQVLSLSIGNGFNSNAIGTNFLVADGYNYFGILKNGSNIPISDLNTYGFDTSYKPTEKNNTTNSNFSIIAGKKFEFANSKSLSVFGVILSNSDYIFKEGKAGQVNSQGSTVQDLDFKKYDYSASQAGLGNIKYKFGSGKSIVYNVLYIHDSNQSVADYNGFARNVNDNSDATNSFIRRQQVNNNSLFSNQLLFDYKISSQWNTSFGASYNTINGSEPDRRTNSYDFDQTSNNYIVGTNTPALNNRFFSKLKEDDFAGRFEVTYTLNPDEDLIKKIAVGANYRNTDRRFDYTQFNFDVQSRVIIDINNPDAFFNQASVNAG
ncbi:MAG TPA: TonB-dependent receptor, partial [Flavobacterium sp.]